MNTDTLNNLTRYGFCDFGVDFGEEKDGPYVKLEDVRAALARQAIAAPVRTGPTPQVDAMMEKWGDDGASRGAAFCELRDLAREMELMLGEMGEPAIAAPVAPTEPVAYMYQDDADMAEPGTGSCVVTKSRNRFYRNETPLYAAPAATAATAAPIVPEEFRAIGKLLATQDNRCTDQPMFVVQQRRRITGLDTDYCENIVWLCSEDDYSEASAEETAQLEAEYQETGRERSGWSRTGYMDEWEFVTACFTEQGCKDYLKRDGHNLKEPRIYAEGSYRNEEYRALRNWLLSLAAAPAAPEATQQDEQAACTHCNRLPGERRDQCEHCPAAPEATVPAAAEVGGTPFNTNLIHSMARKFAIVTCEPGGASLGDKFTFTPDSLMRYIEDIAAFMQAQRDYNSDMAAMRAPHQEAEGSGQDAPLAYGHREDYYLLANARMLAETPIAEIKRTQNWVFAKRLFATGGTSAHQICRDAGIDPDAYTVERTAMSASPATKTAGN